MKSRHSKTSPFVRYTLIAAIFALALAVVPLGCSSGEPASDNSEPAQAKATDPVQGPTDAAPPAADGGAQAAPASGEQAAPASGEQAAPASGTQATPAAGATPAPAPAAGQPEIVAGRDYKETSTPKRLYPDPADDVELVFVFWYACGACRAMDPVFKQYAAIHSDGVKIRTLPALYDKNEFWMMHGRLYFALEQLGKEEELHQAIFEEIQGESPSGAHSHENERLSSLPSIISFVESKGISKEDFQKAWDSPEVQANIDRGLAFIQNVGIEGVPAMAIDGRYSFSISRKGPGFFLATADFLIAKEKAAKTE